MINKYVDKDFGKYFRTLSTYRQTEWLAIELYQRHELGVRTLTDDVLKALKKRKSYLSEDDFMSNSIANYELISNLEY